MVNEMEQETYKIYTRKYGNSIGVRIPPKLIKKHQIKAGDLMWVTILKMGVSDAK